MLRILVLGAAAGGGFPQWNCNCPSCARARDGADSAAPQALQASVAVSADGESWFLLNASPDLRQQINDNPQLHPAHSLRSSPIAGAILTNGDVDAVAGLLNLRESTPFTVYAHPRVLRILADNPIFNVLNPAFVKRRELTLGRKEVLVRTDGSPAGLEVEAFAVPGKVALYLEDESKGDSFGSEVGDTVGLRISNTDDGQYFYFIANCVRLTPDIAERVQGAPLVFFDGTLWRDDEMVAANMSAKTGKRMGHISMGGPDGSIAAFADLGVGRKFFLHINNSNPVLLTDTPERAELEQAGWKIAKDGTEIVI